MIMKENEIMLPIIFTILSYYIISNPSFLTFRNNGELVFFIILNIFAMTLSIISIDELKKYKRMNVKNKLIHTFSLISSLTFLVSTLYSVIIR